MKSVWGILAHVDAGKTTLSEAILDRTGQIKQVGRVDSGNAFLDTDKIEKKRGSVLLFPPFLFIEIKDILLLFYSNTI